MKLELPGDASAGPLTEQPLEAMASEKVRDVHAAWQSVRGTRAMPTREDMSARLLKKYLPDLFVFEVLGPRHAIVRLAGTAMTSVFGSDTTGSQLTADNDDPLTQRTLRIIDRVVETRAPVLVHSRRGAATGMQAHHIESLWLPLSRDGQNVHFVMWIAEITLLPEIARALSSAA